MRTAILLAGLFIAYAIDIDILKHEEIVGVTCAIGVLFLVMDLYELIYKLNKK